MNKEFKTLYIKLLLLDSMFDLLSINFNRLYLDWVDCNIDSEDFVQLCLKIEDIQSLVKELLILLKGVKE